MSGWNNEFLSLLIYISCKLYKEKKVVFLILEINFNFIDPFVMAPLGKFYKFQQHIRKGSTQEM